MLWLMGNALSVIMVDVVAVAAEVVAVAATHAVVFDVGTK